MAYFVGVTLALAVSLFAYLIGLDRDRAFYPTVMFVVAALYGLFAIMGGHPGDLNLEWVMLAVFFVLTTLGFRFSLWLVVAALFGHGVFDFFHTRLVANPGMPVWWPAFCGSYDVVAAACLAWLLWRRGSPKMNA